MLSAYLRRAFELPPHVAAGRAIRLAGRLLAERARRARDLKTCTYAADDAARLVPRLAPAAGDVPESLADALRALCPLYLSHRFDLLGSGWVEVRHGLTAAGLGGHRYPPGPRVDADAAGAWLSGRVTPANLPESQRLWRLVEGPYMPIDWQIDFKSGYRFDERRHFQDLTFGDRPGVDVKVPWELSRLQHLPQLAIACLLAGAGRPGFAAQDVYAREVRNQILDFLAANPPRFGVNWLCPMDVGIRAANILLAVDLLRVAGAPPDGTFEAAVARAAVAHARHIVDHLEWSEAPRSNHYLADLAGLVFCAAYLPASEETDAWLDFAAQQLGAETLAQFLADGGNFEGSTNYHRLSAELELFSAAILLGIADERTGAFSSAARRRLKVRPPLALAAPPAFPWPEAVAGRLRQAVACAAAWSKPDGRPPQIGDTDSGRLFKLHPVVLTGADGAPAEDLLDHRALQAAGAAVTDGVSVSEWFDGTVAAALARGRKLAAAAAPEAPDNLGDRADLDRVVALIRALPDEARRERTLDLPGLAPATLQRRGFPDFGLYVFKNGATFLSLRCVGPGGAHSHGHFHDDNLALEIHHVGRDLVADPGSFLYTPLPEARERYRRAAAHFVPRPEGCAAAMPISAFAMKIAAAARCVYFGPAGVAAILDGGTWQAYRAVLVEEGRVVVLDGGTPGRLAALEPVPMSRGYGRLDADMNFVPV